MTEGQHHFERSENIIAALRGTNERGYAVGVNEVVLRTNDMMLRINDVALRANGHASFFTSPDGTEVWCAYHGMKNPNETVTPVPRFFNIQRIDFTSDGYPVMGLPAGYEVDLIPPSGETE